MTNAPDTRQTHVVRIFGTNKNGDVLPDIWADVERIDRGKSATQMAEGFWQGLQRKFRWSDDPSSDDYEEEGTASRNTDLVKVCSPDEKNVDDPDEWIPLRVIKSLRARGGSTGDQNYQERLINDETAQARVVNVRRIPHYDTNIDADAQAAFDSDPTLKAYVVPGDQYQKDTDTKDDSQYVEHEIIEYFKPSTNNRDKAGDVDSDQQVKLLNQYLIDESDDAKLDVIGANGINPPYRLDPYQNIVNINFGGLAVEFFTGSDYLQSASDIAPIKRGTISFWCRVPAASMAAAKAAYLAASAGADPIPQLCGIVPLMVFGPRDVIPKQINYSPEGGGTQCFEQYIWLPCDWQLVDADSGCLDYTFSIPHAVAGTGTVPNDPCYIGIDCRHDRNVLAFNLQYTSAETTGSATGANMLSVADGFSGTNPVRSYFPTGDINFACSFDASGTPYDCTAVCDNFPASEINPFNGFSVTAPLYSATSTTILSDYSEVAIAASADSIGSSTSSSDANDYGQEVTPDQWHQIIFSFDTNTISVRGTVGPSPSSNGGSVLDAATVYLALDDVNLTGKRLSFYTTPGGDPNDVISRTAAQVFYSNFDPASNDASTQDSYQGYTETQTTVGGGQQSYVWTPPDAKLGTILVPGDENNVWNVEMAELQIFPDVLLDTGVVENRRLFIDDDGKPVPPSVAEDALGKPAIDLHRSGHWINGTNSGSSGVDFVPSGKDIKRYKPDPSLYGPQFPNN